MFRRPNAKQTCRRGVMNYEMVRGVQHLEFRRTNAHAMIRLLLSRAIGHVSIRAFYIVWTRASVLSMLLWAAFTGENSRIAEIGLIIILILLLVGGVVLIALGIRDL